MPFYSGLTMKLFTRFFKLFELAEYTWDCLDNVRRPISEMSMKDLERAALLLESNFELLENLRNAELLNRETYYQIIKLIAIKKGRSEE